MARILDDKGRLFGKINVVDVIVLIVIVALAVFIGLRVSGGDSDKTVPVKMTWSVQLVDSRMAPQYTTLGPLKDRDGNAMGSIEEATIVDSEPLTVTGEAEDTAFSIRVAPDAILEVSADAVVSGDNVRVGMFSANVGGVLYLVGPGWEGTGRVLKVEISEAAE